MRAGGSLVATERSTWWFAISGGEALQSSLGGPGYYYAGLVSRAEGAAPTSMLASVQAEVRGAYSSLRQHPLFESPASMGSQALTRVLLVRPWRVCMPTQRAWLEVLLHHTHRYIHAA